MNSKRRAVVVGFFLLLAVSVLLLSGARWNGSLRIRGRGRSTRTAPFENHAPVRGGSENRTTQVRREPVASPGNNSPSNSANHTERSSSIATSAVVEPAPNSPISVPSGAQAAPADRSGLPSVIRSAIREVIPRIERCYQSALIEAPSLQGSLTLELEIGPTGEADLAQAIAPNFVQQGQSGGAERFLECIDLNVSDFQIPAQYVTEGRLMVRYPIELSAGEDGI